MSKLYDVWDWKEENINYKLNLLDDMKCDHTARM
jgi:hypothetical protein